MMFLDSLKLIWRWITCYQSLYKRRMCFEARANCQLIENNICCLDCPTYVECEPDTRCDINIKFSEPRFIGYFIMDKWRKYLPYYIWYCLECREFVMNYPTSHYETLKCPKCIKKIGKGDVLFNDSLPL